MSISSLTKVLEVGCGNGKLLTGLVDRSSALVALDLSIAALSMVRKRPKMEGVHLVQGDVLALPFPDRSFDMVFCHHVLDHLLQGERKAASDELSRVLDKGGRIDLLVFEQGDMRCGKGEEIEPDTFLRGTGIPYHYFSEEEVRSLFTELEPDSMELHRTSKYYHGRPLQRSRISAVWHRP